MCRRCPSAPTTLVSPTSTTCCARSPPPTRPTSSFVSGPTEWCNDQAIATNLGYRWDGVHVYKPGAKLIFETIAPALLAIRAPEIGRSRLTSLVTRRYSYPTGNIATRSGHG